MDLASIMYFDLTGMATDRIRQADAGPEHSGLSAEELKDLHLVIESFRKALRDAVRAVLEEPFFPAR
jgi:hypothetical protein